MATSKATLWIGPPGTSPGNGGYNFLPVPQVGIRDDYEPIGENKLGPTNRRKVVTLKGHFSGANLNVVQTQVAALEAAMAIEEQTIYFNDGANTRINTTCRILSFDVPVQWGQYHTDWTITLTYIPLDDVHRALCVCSYGSYIFCDLGANVIKPMPALGRSMKPERQSPDAWFRESSRVNLTLIGFIEAGSISANLAALAALDAALATDGLMLTYGTFQQTVKVLGWEHHADTLTRRISYVINFMYTENTGTYNIIKISSNVEISRVTQRYAPHLVPFLDFATVQLLGRGAQKISCSGYVICADSLNAGGTATIPGSGLANAQLAAIAEIALRIPVVDGSNVAAGVENPSGKIKLKPYENRVDWNVERYYPIPVAATAGTPGTSPVPIYTSPLFGNGLQ